VGRPASRPCFVARRERLRPPPRGDAGREYQRLLPAAASSRLRQDARRHAGRRASTADLESAPSPRFPATRWPSLVARMSAGQILRVRPRGTRRGRAAQRGRPAVILAHTSRAGTALRRRSASTTPHGHEPAQTRELRAAFRHRAGEEWAGSNAGPAPRRRTCAGLPPPLDARPRVRGRPRVPACARRDVRGAMSTQEAFRRVLRRARAPPRGRRDPQSYKPLRTTSKIVKRPRVARNRHCLWAHALRGCTAGNCSILSIDDAVVYTATRRSQDRLVRVEGSLVTLQHRLPWAGTSYIRNYRTVSTVRIRTPGTGPATAGLRKTHTLALTVSVIELIRAVGVRSQKSTRAEIAVPSGRCERLTRCSPGAIDTIAANRVIVTTSMAPIAKHRYRPWAARTGSLRSPPAPPGTCQRYGPAGKAREPPVCAALRTPRGWNATLTNGSEPTTAAAQSPRGPHQRSESPRSERKKRRQLAASRATTAARSTARIVTPTAVVSSCQRSPATWRRSERGNSPVPQARSNRLLDNGGRQPESACRAPG